MKRLLIVNPTLGVGGVERKIADIAQYLSNHPEMNVSVDVVLEQKLDDASQAIFLNPVQNSPFRLHFKPSTPFLSFFLFVLYQIVTLKPDIILAFSRRPSILVLTIRALLFWRHTPIVLGNDTIASEALKVYVQNPLVQKILQTQMRWLYPRATLILAPSETSKRDLVENFRVAPERVRVLKNWTPVVTLPDASKEFDLVYVGRVDKVKQLSRLVEMTALLVKTLPKLRVVIVGDGNDMREVQRVTREHHLEQHIKFVGFQTDIAFYLSRAKIFCLTSRFEGLPIAALEAMAYGLPIVTLAYPGAAELVSHGETGYVCANADEFCAAIIQLLINDSLLARLGNQARALVQREHSEQVLSDYVQAVFTTFDA